jgi:hypothetical protein
LDFVGKHPECEKLFFWTDECNFYTNGTITLHNSYCYAREDPGFTLPEEHYGKSVTVWCAVNWFGIVGPFFFDQTVNAVRYLHLLQTEFFPKVDEMKLAKFVFFQQDGATPHTSSAVIYWLKWKTQDRLLSLKGNVDWPARSPDLTPPDFWLWGVLKEKVYSRPHETVRLLKQNSIDAVHSIPALEAQKAVQTIKERLKRCIENKGGHVD